MAKSKTKSEVSGVAVGIGIIAMGAILGFWLSDSFFGATNYISAALMLIGLAGILVEVQSRLRLSKPGLRLNNLGVGIILLAPSIWLLALAHEYLSGWLRLLSVAMLLIVFLFGAVGTLDGLASIFKAMNTSGKTVVNALKFIGLVGSTILTIFAALERVGVIK